MFMKINKIILKGFIAGTIIDGIAIMLIRQWDWTTVPRGITFIGAVLELPGFMIARFLKFSQEVSFYISAYIFWIIIGIIVFYLIEKMRKINNKKETYVRRRKYENNK